MEVHGCSITIERIYGVRIGQQLGQEGLKYIGKIWEKKQKQKPFIPGNMQFYLMNWSSVVKNGHFKQNYFIFIYEYVL